MPGGQARRGDPACRGRPGASWAGGPHSAAGAGAGVGVWPCCPTPNPRAPAHQGSELHEGGGGAVEELWGQPALLPAAVPHRVSHGSLGAGHCGWLPKLGLRPPDVGLKCSGTSAVDDWGMEKESSSARHGRPPECTRLSARSPLKQACHCQELDPSCLPIRVRTGAGGPRLWPSPSWKARLEKAKCTVRPRGCQEFPKAEECALHTQTCTCT